MIIPADAGPEQIHDLLRRTSTLTGDVCATLTAQGIPHRVILAPDGIDLVLPEQIQSLPQLCDTLSRLSERFPLRFKLDPALTFLTPSQSEY